MVVKIDEKLRQRKLNELEVFLDGRFSSEKFLFEMETRGESQIQLNQEKDLVNELLPTYEIENENYSFSPITSEAEKTMYKRLDVRRKV